MCAYLEVAVSRESQSVTGATEMFTHRGDEPNLTFEPLHTVSLTTECEVWNEQSDKITHEVNCHVPYSFIS